MSEQHQLASPLVTRGVGKYVSFVHHSFIENSVWTFAELGVADLLVAEDKPQTADELARKQGWNSNFLYRLLRTVADADIVREIQSEQDKDQESLEPEKTKRFELTEDGRLLTSDHSSKARYLILSGLGPLNKRASEYFPQLVREGYAKGNGFEQTTGNRSLFEYMKDPANQEFAHRFNEDMTSISTVTGVAVADAVDFSPFSTLVDIGGNLGILLASILAKYPSIKQGICFDLPNVIEKAVIGREFKQRNVSPDRYRFVAGDMFKSETIPQADAYIMQNIIHDWSDERCIDFLKAIRTAAKGQPITLFIVGFVILPQTEGNKLINLVAHALDIHMLILLGAEERTQKQHEYLLEQSGFQFKRLHKTSTSYWVVEATAN